MDKWAYYRQHPDSYRRTQKDIDAFAVAKERADSERERREKAKAKSGPQGSEKASEKQTAKESTETMPGTQQPGCDCLAGWVIEECKQCRAK